MSTLIVIPARLGATRLPRKPLRLLGGKPLIVRVWERVSGMNLADRVVIATDSDEVAAAARSARAEVAMTRHDHPSGTDRVAEVSEKAEYASYGIVVNVQGDEPFISREAVNGALGLVTEKKFAVATAACSASAEILASPDVVKVVCEERGRALYFSRAPIPFMRDSSDAALRDSLIKQHLGVYACSRYALQRWVSLPVHPLEQVERLEQLRPLADGIAIGVATVTAVTDARGIDTEEDLIAANARWSSHESTHQVAGKY